MNRVQGSGFKVQGSNAQAILSVTGRGLPLRGNDVDTDRIMPARFLVSVSFEGLERHLFEDDRAADPKHGRSVDAHDRLGRKLPRHATRTRWRHLKVR